MGKTGKRKMLFNIKKVFIFHLKGKILLLRKKEKLFIQEIGGFVLKFNKRRSFYKGMFHLNL